MAWLDISDKYEHWVKIVIIIVASFLINKLTRYLLSSYFKRESARINVDPTTYNFLKNAVTFIIIIVATLNIIYAIPQFKQVAITLFAGAGILAAIIGFASQTAFSNIINGVMIVAFKPFRIGDIIEIGANNDEFTGMVEDITLRHTVIRNFENKRVVIPNSVISTEIIVNRSLVDQRMIRFFVVRISYKTPIDRAIEVIRDEVEKHPLFIDPRTEEEIAAGEPKVVVRVVELGEYAVTLRAYIWAKDSTESFIMLTDLNKIIKERFDKEGIEIPYPYRNLVMRNQVE